MTPFFILSFGLFDANHDNVISKDELIEMVLELAL